MMKINKEKIANGAIVVGVISVVASLLYGCMLMFIGILNTSQISLPGPFFHTEDAPFASVNTIAGTHRLELIIANTQEEREQGLMGVSELDANSGMLFIFSDEVPRIFWMKDTLIPLDIIFLDNNMVVVGIAENTKPNQTEEVYPSVNRTRYAIETNAGWVSSVGLKIGDKITINFGQ